MVLNDAPCTGVGQYCLGVFILVLAVNELFEDLNELFEAGLKLVSHLKKSHPFLDAALCLTEQEKKNLPVFCPGDCTILRFDRLPHLHSGGVDFIADPGVPDTGDGVLNTEEEFTLLLLFVPTGDGVLKTGFVVLPLLIPGVTNVDI